MCVYVCDQTGSGLQTNARTGMISRLITIHLINKSVVVIFCKVNQNVIPQF